MLLGRRFAFGFLVCLQAACASGSRNPAPEAPVAAPSPPQPTADVGVTPPDSAAAITPAGDPGGCVVGPAVGEPITILGLGHDIEPSNAPRPSNESERLLFRQVYETLVRADCQGRVVPALADSWRLDADGRTWILTLRDAARFSDGTPVTAADVRASWLGDGGTALHQEVNRLVEAIDPVGDRTMTIRLRHPRVDTPLSLAHPDLAVGKVTADSRWPLGTRGARIEGTAGARRSAASRFMLTSANHPPIQLQIARGDSRDLLDRGVDLLLTGDPAALEYAATLPRFQSIPLAWQRTFVLLAPGRPHVPSLPDEARQRLADDAVRGEARGARGPYWWDSVADCALPAVSLPRGQQSLVPQIVYEAGEGVARDLAERFVGLAQAPRVGAILDAILPDRPRRMYERARGLSGAALEAALRRGADAGYIVSIDKRPTDHCRDMHGLMERAPWLDPGTMLPLVEARVQAVMRRGIAGVTAEWDGGLLIVSPITP